MKILDFVQPLKEKKMPLGRKKIKKLGTLKPYYAEATPFVWHDELYLFEWVRSDEWTHNGNEVGYYHIVRADDGEEVSKFGNHHAFGCCYEENGTVYVHGVRGSSGWTNQVDVFWSDDMVHWQMRPAFTVPDDMFVFNTSVCKDDDGYVMAIEVGTENGSHPVIGCNYTNVYARSKDLFNWELLPMDTYIFTPEQYSACPSIRYFNGYYYIIFLAYAPFFRLMPYIVRTSDLETYEIGHVNPIMMPDDDDKKIPYPERLTQEEINYIENAFDINNSDVDLCEYKGKTVFTYAWGNQNGKEFLGMAEYDGTMQEFCESCFFD